MKRTMKIRVQTVVALALLAPVLGLMVSVAGLVPIAASSGHFAVTAWFLHFSMRRSVATHSLMSPSPPELDEAHVMRGAGHYHHGCRFCHGAPGQQMPAVPEAMTPNPPRLDEIVPELDDEDLFYIVKHGVKFTGMPAWPAQERDDEVWAVVAFLRQLPELDEAEYQTLVHPEAIESEGVPEIVMNACVRCHGADGQGRIPGAFPELAGQTEAYLLRSLESYADGDRHSGIMEPVAVALSPNQLQIAARYYAQVSPMRPSPGEPSLLGALIANAGIVEDKIPACRGCHGPGEEVRNDAYPILAGQDPRYLEQQLELFNQDARGGTVYVELMQTVAAHDLEPEQIQAVADYYAKLSTTTTGSTLGRATAGALQP